MEEITRGSQPHTAAETAHPFEVVVKVEPMESGESDEDVPATSDSPHAFTCGAEVASSPLALDGRDAVPHPGGDALRCLHCHRDLAPPDLQRHMTTEHGYRRVLFKCQVCSNTFHERTELIEHRKKKHIKPAEFVNCEICYQPFGKKYLKKHMRYIHRATDVMYKCDLCEKKFKWRETLNDHVKVVHLGAESVNCKLCSQSFRSKKYLLNHLRNVHPTGERKFKCKACTKTFKSRMCLHQHTKNVHPPVSASAQCELCPKVFKTRANLSQHMRHCHPEAEKISTREVKNNPGESLKSEVDSLVSERPGSFGGEAVQNTFNDLGDFHNSKSFEIMNGAGLAGDDLTSPAAYMEGTFDHINYLKNHSGSLLAEYASNPRAVPVAMDGKN